jgi:polysaccharide biosynthesis transport protein
MDPVPEPSPAPESSSTEPTPVQRGSYGYAGGGYPVRASDDGQPNVAAYLRTLAKRWRLILGTFLALAVPGAILSFMGPDIYQARARIVIDTQTPEMTAIRPTASPTPSDEIQTHAAELRSRAVAHRAIVQLKIWQNPAFNVDNEPPFWNPRALLAGASGFVRGLFGPRGRGAAASAPAAGGSPADQPGLVEAFLGHLAVDPLPLSRLIDIKYSSSDPRLSADAANALARAYVEHDLESRFQSAKVAADWLDGQLAEQRKRVSDSLSKLQDYREAEDVPSLDGRQQNVVSQKLSDLNAALTRAKTERIAKEAAYNQLLAIQRSKGALDTLPAVLSSAYIQQQKSQLAALQQERTRLSEQYGEKMPEMIRVNSAIEAVEARLNGEIEKIVQSVRNDFLTAQGNESSLAIEYEKQKQEALGLSRKSVDYAALEREAQSNQQIYDSLLQQAKQAGMAGELRRGNVRITDPADVPLAPIAPRRTQNLLLAVLGAGLFAVGLAFGLEYLAHEINSPGDLERYLQIPFLGFIPMLPGSGTNGRRPLFLDDQKAGFGESFRRIRTHVMLQAPQSGLHTVLVTSTGPGEGKTVVTANLAVALAKTGLSVAVVDADMRKPRLSYMFGKRLEPGLSNVLSGQCAWADAVGDTAVTGLRLLPAGAGPDNPAELLSSPRFKSLLTSLQAAFQWVIVDAPPVLAVTDSTLIANDVRNVLFVVGAGMVDRDAAQTAVGELQRAEASILGGVLNKVNLARDSGLYSRYYKPEDEAYYVKGRRTQASDTSTHAERPKSRHTGLF